jgi:NAD(P)H-hydrate epimerase
MLVDEPIRLPARARDAHKGDFGRVLVIAGSRGMSGAAVLAGSAALRGGAGLVRVAVPRGIWSIVAAAHPCYMTAALDEDPFGRLSATALDDLREQLRWATVVVAGPGLGHGEELGTLLSEIVAGHDRPLVLDADGLNLLAVGRLELLSKRTAPTILTPHPGEFARLTGQEIVTGEARRMEAAEGFVREYPCVLVLKGAGTIVADRQRLYINRTGNPGMATGGTGDVLSGLLGALVAQGLDSFEAAALGVYVHGLAGDRAAERLGDASLLATDLLDEIPGAMRSRLGERSAEKS